jgi:hypothetical protein
MKTSQQIALLCGAVVLMICSAQIVMAEEVDTASVVKAPPVNTAKFGPAWWGTFYGGPVSDVG